MLDTLFVIAALAGRICLGLVFLLAAIQKMRHWRVLEGVISNYRLLPLALVKPAALLLPLTELVLGLMLLSGLAVWAAAISGIVLLLIFAGAMAINIGRGRSHIDCGCHQSFLRQTLKPVLVARNIALAAILAPAVIMTAGPMPVLRPVGFGAGLAFFLLYLVINALAALPILDQPPIDAGALS